MRRRLKNISLLLLICLTLLQFYQPAISLKTGTLS